MPRRLKRVLENANAKINQGGGVMTKVDALMSAVLEELKPEDVEKLSVHLGHAGHMLNLVYAAAEDVTPEQVRTAKAKAREVVAAVKAVLDKNGDGRITTEDFTLIVKDLVPFPLNLVVGGMWPWIRNLIPFLASPDLPE